MSETLSNVLATLGTALASIIAALFIVIQRKVFQKLNWQVSAAAEEAERAFVEKVVLYVEQWAARELKTKVLDHAGAKLAKAKALIQEKHPWLADPDLEATIEAALARLHLGPIAHK
jgi:hypothetical protein